MDTIITRDPYRNRETTLRQFADEEGVHLYTVQHFYWYHRTLEGFRERPKSGNGIKPHTYQYKGKSVSIAVAKQIARCSGNTLKRYKDRGIVDVERVRKSLEDKRQKNTKRYETDDGVKMSIAEFARSRKVTYNTVSCYYHRKHTLKGFDSRGYSRIHPKMYRHKQLGMTKTLTEWAEYFGVTKDALKNWIKHHNSINGYESRRRAV